MFNLIAIILKSVEARERSDEDRIVSFRRRDAALHLTYIKFLMHLWQLFYFLSSLSLFNLWKTETEERNRASRDSIIFNNIDYCTNIKIMKNFIPSSKHHSFFFQWLRIKEEEKKKKRDAYRIFPYRFPISTSHNPRIHPSIHLPSYTASCANTTLTGIPLLFASSISPLPSTPIRSLNREHRHRSTERLPINRLLLLLLTEPPLS